MLAYNNAVYQTALIVSPLGAGAIYTWNHEWVFYSSAILVVLGGLTMAYMCTWKNVKTIGKKMEVSKELPKENAVEVKVEGGEQKEVHSNPLNTLLRSKTKEHHNKAISHGNEKGGKRAWQIRALPRKKSIQPWIDCVQFNLAG